MYNAKTVRLISDNIYHSIYTYINPSYTNTIKEKLRKYFSKLTKLGMLGITQDPGQPHTIS